MSEVKNFDLPLGWLSPTGEFIECNFAEHYSTAEDILSKDPVGILKDGCADDQLINFGWVRISMKRMFVCAYEISWNTDRHLSYEQFSFLQKYFKAMDTISPHTIIRWEKECDTR